MKYRATSCSSVLAVALILVPAIASPQVRVDSGLLARSDKAEVNVVLQMRRDAPQLPFSRTPILSTPEGVAGQERFRSELLTKGASHAVEIAPGMISSKLPPGLLRVLAKDSRLATLSELEPLDGMESISTARRIVSLLPPTGSLPSINEGNGKTIVVIDGGFDPTNPALAGVPIEERCYSPENNFCPGGTASATGPGSSRPRTVGTSSARYHGTAVAAAIASQAGVSIGADVTDDGAVPSVGLILISAQRNWGTSGNPLGGFIDQTGVIQALNWVKTAVQSGRTDIVAVNLSLGRSLTAGETCASTPQYAAYVAVVNELTSNGVAVIAAGGNDAASPVALPACIPNVIAVAESINSTSLAGVLQQGSQGTQIDVVAPGYPMETATTVSNGTSRSAQIQTFGGTSASAPVVSGCVAAIASAINSALQVDSLATAFSSSSAVATNSSWSFPILNCAASLSLIQQGGNELTMNRYGLSGTFFHPSTNGQGLVWEITQNFPAPNNGNFFGAWFTYENDVNPYRERGLRWYTIQSNLFPTATTTRLRARIYRNGPGTFLEPKDPSFVATPVGNACIIFRSCDSATLRFQWSSTDTDICGPAQVAGVRELPLQRVAGSAHQCSASNTVQDDIAQDPPLVQVAHDLPWSVTGAWVRVGTGVNYESQGWLVDVNPEVPLATGGAFIAWFTYAAASDPSPAVERLRWVTFQNARKRVGASKTYDFDIYFTRGGVFGRGFPAPQTTLVGAASIQFQTCAQATLTYSFNSSAGPELTGIGSTSGVINIQKLTPLFDPSCVVQ